MVLHWMTSCIIQDPTEFVWKGLSLKCVLRFGTQWKFIQSYMYIYVRKSIIGHPDVEYNYISFV